MPIFVGSNSDDSRIRSNRVGFAVSTANPGTASEGDVYFNSSDSGLRAYDGSAWSAVGAGGGTFSGIASGTLANGQTVIIQSDGTVKAVSGVNQSVGISSVYATGEAQAIAAVFDSTNNRVVIAFADSTNSAYGTAVVGTVSGTSISFGTPVVYNSTDSNYFSIGMAFDSSNGKVVIAYSYQDIDTSRSGKAVVGTVDPSDNSISFGTPVEYNTSNLYYVSATYDSTNEKVVIVYRDAGNSNYGTARVGTVSGTSISFGSKTVFESANIAYASAVYDSANGKVVIAYRDNGNSKYGTAVVGTVSGTSISFGTPVVYESASIDYASTTYDSTNEKVVIVYRDAGNSNYGTAIVGTVSGTSISFGSPVVFNSGTTLQTYAAYDSNAQKVVITYRDGGNSNYATALVGTVSGTSISFGSEVVLESSESSLPTSTFDSTNNVVVVAYKVNSSPYGKAIVFQNASTNLTTENFIGFSDAAYSDGATATIQMVGAVDDAQSGLTTGSLHYVQTDGTLSTTAGNPSVEAGTALSATKIKVKK